MHGEEVLERLGQDEADEAERDDVGDDIDPARLGDDLDEEGHRRGGEHGDEDEREALAGRRHEERLQVLQVEVDEEDGAVLDEEIDQEVRDAEHDEGGDPDEDALGQDGRLDLVDIDGELGPGEADVLAALRDDIEDEGHDAEVGQEGGRQVHQGLDDAELGHEHEREEDEVLLEDDADGGQEHVEEENERRVAEEEALVGRGDDGAALVEVALGDAAGRAEGGDGPLDRGVVRCPGRGGALGRSSGFLQDVGADVGQDLLPFVLAGEEVADLFEVTFELVRHGGSPW